MSDHVVTYIVVLPEKLRIYIVYIYNIYIYTFDIIQLGKNATPKTLVGEETNTQKPAVFVIVCPCLELRSWIWPRLYKETVDAKGTSGVVVWTNELIPVSCQDRLPQLCKAL